MDPAEQFFLDFVRLTELVASRSERSGNQIGTLGPFVRKCELTVVELQPVMRPVYLRGDDPH